MGRKARDVHSIGRGLIDGKGKHPTEAPHRSTPALGNDIGPCGHAWNVGLMGLYHHVTNFWASRNFLCSSLYHGSPRELSKSAWGLASSRIPDLFDNPN